MMENFEKMEEEMVTSLGKFGRCHAPEHMLCPRRFPLETVKILAVGSVALVDKTHKSSTASLEIVERILCKECAIEIYGNDYLRDAVLHPSDATFRCPALGREGSCNSEAVSYRQFFTGSCCEPASRWLTKNEKGQKEKLKIIDSFRSKLMTELKKANDTSKALITEKQILDINLKLNEKRREDLEKFIEKSKKNAREKEVKLAELKLKVHKLNEEHDLASKRMNLLSFEYFDVAKKSEDEKIESSHCPKCGLMYGVRVFDNFKCILRCSYKCGYHACARCIKRVLDDSTIEGRRCPKCGEDFKKEDILKA